MSFNKNNSCVRNNGKGQGMVEFALSIPLFILIVVGVIEIGFLFQSWVTLQTSVQEGARYATTGQEFADPDDDLMDTVRLNAIKEVVRARANALRINDSALYNKPGYFHVSVYASDSPVAGLEYPGGPNARVVLFGTFNYEPVTPFLRGIFPFLELTAHAEKINERFRHPGYGTPAGFIPPTIVTPTRTSTPTFTATSTATSTPINSPTFTLTSTITLTPTVTLTPTISLTPTITLTPTETEIPTETPEQTETPEPTNTPVTPTANPVTPTAAPTPFWCAYLPPWWPGCQ